MEAYLTELAKNGILAIIVGWFMFRIEKVVNNNTKVLYSVKEMCEIMRYK